MALKREEVQDLGRVLGGGLGALLSPDPDIPLSTDPLLLLALPKCGSGGLEGQEAETRAMSVSVTYSPCRLAGDFLLREPDPVPGPPDPDNDDDDPAAGVTSTTLEPGLWVRRVTVWSWFGVEDFWWRPGST